MVCSRAFPERRLCGLDCGAHSLWQNRIGIGARRTQARTTTRPKKPIKNRHSGTSRFSKPWRCPAAKYRAPNFPATSTGIPLSLRPSMPYNPGNYEDPKLGLAAEMLRCGGTVRLRAWGASMLPSVWPGDLLTIQSAAHDEVVPGDIALVMRDNRFFVHRLVETRRDGDCFSWITRGDAMPQNDSPAAASELLGRVVGISRANRSCIPSRRVSLLQSALAKMLCHSDRLRALALRIHAAHQVLGIPATSSIRPSNL